MADSNVLALSYVGDTLRWAKANARAEKTQEVDLALQLDARRRAMEDSSFQKMIILDGLERTRKDMTDKLSDLNVTAPGMFEAAGLKLSDDMKSTLGKMKNPETASSVITALMNAMIADRDHKFRQRVQAKAEGRNTLDAWTAVIDNYGKVSSSAMDALMGAGNDPAKVDEAIAENTGSTGDVAPLVALYNIMGYGKRPEYSYTPPPWGTLRMFPVLQDVPKDDDGTIREANAKALLSYQAENNALLADPNNVQITELLKPQYVDEKGNQLPVPSIAVMKARRRIETLNRNIAPHLATLQGSDRVGKLADAIRTDPGLIVTLNGGKAYGIKGEKTGTYTPTEYKKAKALAGGQAPAASGTQADTKPLSREQAIQNVLDNPFNLTPEKVTAWAQRAGMSYNDLLFAADSARKTKSGNAE